MRIRILAVVILMCGMAWAGPNVAVLPFYNGKPQFFTNGGLICSGCLLYSYQAGTTTPLATYPSYTNGGVTNSNPIVLDSAGRADIWITASTYKFTLKTSAGIVIWTVDFIPSPANYTSLQNVTITGTLTSGPATIGSSVSSGSGIGSGVTGGTVLNLVNAGTGATVGLSTTLSSSGGTDILLNGTNGTKLISGTNAAASEVFAVANNGQITSNLATGTAPFVIASTTPVANLTGQILAYSISGTQQTSYHAIVGSCVLGTSCAITLTNAAVYTNSGSYFCWTQDVTAAAATKIVYTSGSAFTITGTGTDGITFGCIGN